MDLMERKYSAKVKVDYKSLPIRVIKIGLKIVCFNFSVCFYYFVTHAFGVSLVWAFGSWLLLLFLLDSTLSLLCLFNDCDSRFRLFLVRVQYSTFLST